MQALAKSLYRIISYNQVKVAKITYWNNNQTQITPRGKKQLITWRQQSIMKFTNQTHSASLYQMFDKDQPVKIIPAIKRNFCLGSILFDLIEGTSTKRISTNQACLPTFLLIIVGHLSYTECVTYLISDTSSLILSLHEHFGVMYNFYDRNILYKFTAVIIMK